MSELRPVQNETLSQGIQQYLDPEQADMGSLRKFLGNLAGNVSEYLGTDVTLPEIIDAVKMRREMNDRYQEHVLPTSRDKYPPIPEDSIPAFEKQSMMSMMPMGSIVSKSGNATGKLAPEIKQLIEDKLMKRGSGQVGSYHAVEDIIPQKK
jgi:hypothetical protein